MKFINIFLERPRILFLTLAFILLSGISSLFSVPIQENPELAERWGNVGVFYPGASPERIETQVINDLEIKLREIVEIDELDSIISQGYSKTHIELEDSVPPDKIEETWSRIQGKLDQIIPPDEATVILNRTAGPPITLEYIIDWNGDGEPPIIMMSRLAQQLKRKLSSIPLTKETAVYGETDEEIIVEIDSAKMSSLNLTYGDVANSIRSFDNKKPVGVISNNNSEFLIRLKDNINSPQKVGEIPVKIINQSEIIRLQDIGNISIEPASPVEDIFLYNGKQVISVSATGTMSQRVYDYVDRVEAVVEEMRQVLPEEFSINRIYDESIYVSSKFSELIKSFSIAAFFVLSLSFLLLGIRPGLIVTAILPFSVSLVLLGCRLIGLPLHMTSITGIIIALGLLIDNGIIVVEDYKFRRSQGLSVKESINETLIQLTTPLAAATGTTVFAFMPIVTGEGSSVEFVGGLAITVIMSIIASLVLALIMVPVLMSYMEKIPYFANIKVHEEGYRNEKLLRKYKTFLTWAFEIPRRAILVSISLPFLGFLLFNTIDKDFFPSSDRDMFRVHIDLPENSSSIKTAEKARLIREQILQSDLIEIEKDYWFVGRWMPRVLMNIVGGMEKTGSNNSAQAVFFARDYYEMIDKLPELSRLIVSKNPDTTIYIDSFYSGPPFFSDIRYDIFGDDENVLLELGSELELIINDAPDISHTRSEATSSNTNVEFEFDSSNISLAGKNTELMVNELFAANNGLVISSMLDSNIEIPIRVKGLVNSSDITGDSSSISISNSDSIDFIGNYSKTSLNKSPSTITRISSQRVNIVEGWVWTGTLASETESYIHDEVERFKKNLPPGYSIKQSGEAEVRGDSQSQIWSSAIVYIFFITIGLVFALNSFRETALILSVAFLSMGLSFVGLIVGFQNFGFIATIGAIGLIGLSINDSIIVLSHIKERARKSLMTKSDLIEVVIRSTRHIITTSLTTLGGFVPLIFASIFFRPLAWAMSVGVLGATLTALLYIPAMYIWMKKITD
ncbi:MAG: efflux RND transporter permease subunit [SAR86 cluster bacterium]|uniref:Efflux RND transporter permease subunit n=1 Tax=SAR86 cluster bacterium TaxID=2030880 RepID=A0A520MSV4_9GAMM|nr:MAG: efflux RND transporter permease subunit [SAR86 cluster bacterium]